MEKRKAAREDPQCAYGCTDWRGWKGRREADGAIKKEEQLTGLKRMGSVHRWE
jgi:hypothetical protein